MRRTSRTDLNRARRAVLAIGVVLASAAASIAHDPGAPTPDIQINVDGGNALVANYPFDTSPIVRVFDTGFADVFAADDPGFAPGEADSIAGLSSPAIGTEVGIEILATEPNVQLRVGLATLDQPLETANLGTHDDMDAVLSSLHTHGEWQLLLDTASGRRFGEGRITFRLYDVAGTLGASTPQTLELSNGYLPGAAIPDRDSVKCTKSLTRETGRFLGATHSTLSRCLNAADAFLVLGSSGSKAVKACDVDPASSGMVGRILAARAKALDKIERACGDLSTSSQPYTRSAVEAHLDMARCRAEELIGASYDNARDTITDSIEGTLFGSACVASTCVGGLADGLSCTIDDDCETKTLVTAATVCMAEAAIPE